MTEEHITTHVDELRKRLYYIAISWLLTSALSYAFIQPIFNILIYPLNRKLMFTSPQEALIVGLKVAALCGIILTLPIIFWNIWRFITPGITKKEKILLLTYTPCIIASFVAGVAFAYFIVLPISLTFLLNFGGDALLPMITISEYINFSLMLILSLGLVFELPLVVMFLTHIELVDHKMLAKRRPHAILILLLLAAFITPPDVFTMIMIGIPLVLLYELSIWISYIILKKRG